MIKEIMSCESLQEWETQLIQEIDRICKVITGVLEGSGVFSGKQEFWKVQESRSFGRFRKAGVLEGSGVFAGKQEFYNTY